MKRILAPLPALLALVATASGAQQVHVDAIHGDDATGLGTAGAPFRTITKGVQSLTPVSGPTTVHVAPGLYNLALGETFPIDLAKEMSLVGSGAHHTVLSGDGNGILVDLDTHSMISDVTVQRGEYGVQSIGPAFTLSAGQVRYVRRCILVNNEVGLRVRDEPHSDHGVAVVNSLIANNATGILHESPDNDFQSVTLMMYGTTVTKNDRGMMTTGFGEIFLGMFNSIVWGNTDDTICCWSTSFFPGFTGNILGPHTFTGSDGNISANPQFVAANQSDAHLRPTSTIIDNTAPPPVWPPSAVYVGPTAWIWEATFEQIRDLDGDPRLSGAFVDPGYDEIELPTLYTHKRPELGKTMEIRGQGDPNATLLVFVSGSLLPAPLFGLVWIAPPWIPVGGVVLDPDGVGSLPVALPGDPLLAGVDLYLQAVRFVPAGFEATNFEWIRLLP